jgi:phosphoribosylaminoimidazole carboxylase PurE protein
VKKVAIIMGSDSDAPTMLAGAEMLDRFGISYEVEVMSAHRTPERLRSWTEEARSRGIGVIIAGAGGAAHLAGVVAAHTTLPVIGVPLDASPLHGVDALYATVQMPAGVPVACMAIGKAGAVNAAILATEILAVSDEALAVKLAERRAEMAAEVAAKSERLKASLPGRAAT